jgi:ATP-binding cassette subfamily B protein
MGFFGGLQAEPYDRQYSDRELVRRMAAYFGKHRRRLTAIVLALLAVSGMNAAIPLIVSYGVDMLDTRSSPTSMYLLAGAVFILGFLVWLMNWIRRRLTIRTVGDVMLALREDAFTASASHDLSFHDQFSSGRIVSRITSDTRDFSQVIVLVTDLASQIVQSLILMVVLINIEWQLSLWVFGILPIVFASGAGFRRIARRVTRRGLRAIANVNAAIKEAVTGIAIAKNFRQETAIYNQFDEVNETSYITNVQRGLVLTSAFPVLNILGGAATALLVYVGGMSAAQGAVTVGAWYLFITSLDRFWFPVLNLASFWSQIQSGLSAAERVFALLDTEAVVVQVDDRRVPELRGEIEFAQLDFRYVEGEGILEQFSLNVHPGENLALVGHTGAGKTSIARLIARFYEFQGGQLLIDGEDIRSFDLHEYRRQLGIVSQVPFLFAGTVVDNIRYARPEARDDEIEALAMRIGNGEWLEAMPDGLQTQVGERGGLLSMGQRQLVALMRVLVQHPALFILDEATASVDPFTEAQIQEALGMILAESTSILIAHRLSTVRAADRIIVLKEGKIIEEGDHTGLMSKGGHYAELYNTYFRHQSPDYRPSLEPDRANLGFVEVRGDSSGFDDK